MFVVLFFQNFYMLKNIHNKKLKKTQRLFKQFIIEVPFGIFKKGSKGILYEI